MRIVIKRVNQKPEVKEVANELHELQSIVGGYLETVLISNDPLLLCVCNEEGKLQGLEPNFIFGNDVIVGDVFFCGANEEDFTSLDDAQVNWLLHIFDMMEKWNVT